MRVLAISHERDAGPGVFADAIRDVGGRLDVWHRAETDDPPAEAGAYDAVITFGGAMHVDQGDEHLWIGPELAYIGELLERRVPLMGVCLGAQLLVTRRGRRGAARARARDRLVRGRADAGRRVGPPAGGARAGLRGVRVAQLRVRAARRRHLARD